MSTARTLEPQWEVALAMAEGRASGLVLVRLELSCLAPAKGRGEVFVGAHFGERPLSAPAPWTEPQRRVSGQHWPPEGTRIEPIFHQGAYDPALAASAEAWVVRVSRDRALPAPYLLGAADA